MATFGMFVFETWSRSDFSYFELKATGQSSSSKGSLLRLSMAFMNETIPSIMELKCTLARAIKQLNTKLPQVPLQR